LKRNLDERDVVDLCGHAVHAIGRRADEDLLATGDAEGADKGVDSFV
jgi:hypothetical protein